MAHTPTFYWHDYETFGLNRYVDRPAQFAGLRTALDFVPQGEPDVWYCKPSLDYLPDVRACYVTGITPQLAHERGLPEAQFAGRIFERFNTPETIVVGYNNFHFDDEVTRALFWRNLYDMYAHQFRNGCSRWDLYPFVLAVWALRDEGIVWPKRQSNLPEQADLVSFRLEKLTEANGIAHTHAHDAASDVLATAALAKFLADKQPRLWQWALKNRTKQAVASALQSAVQRAQSCLWVDPAAGQRAGFLRFVVPISTAPVNKNEVIVWDCRFDPSQLVSMSAQDIYRLAFAPKDKRAEGEVRMPLCRLKINQSPFVCADLRVVTPRVLERFAIDMDAIDGNVKRLSEVLTLIQGPVMQALELANDARAASDDVDLALYEAGFMGELDRDQASRMHAMDAQTIAERVAEGKLHFDDPRLNELLFRMRAHSWPETLNASERERWRAHCRKMLSGVLTHRIGLQEYFDLLDACNGQAQLEHENGKMDDALYQARIDVLEALYQWGECAGECMGEEDFQGEDNE